MPSRTAALLSAHVQHPLLELDFATSGALTSLASSNGLELTLGAY